MSTETEVFDVQMVQEEVVVEQPQLRFKNKTQEESDRIWDDYDIYVANIFDAFEDSNEPENRWDDMGNYFDGEA